MSIQPLPEDVIARIKSSTAITSLNSAVCGLIKNSLDAGATKIAISVDYARGSCSVEDNGLGIPPAEFRSSGGLGKLHFTSKYPGCEDVHGKHGAFLASLAALSLFSVTSHHHKYHSHNSIRFHNSDVLARHTPSPVDQRLLSFPHGTRATVRDLFGSMPVRVKQRAMDVDKGLHSKHWELLKRDVVALMLAWNGPIAVSGQEPSSRWAFSLRCGDLHENGKATDLNLTARVCTVLYQAQLSDERSLETWVPLSASAGGLSVVGAVSLYPIATKRIQFISIGICPVSNEHGSNVLYEEINRAFSNSSYGVEEQPRNSKGDEQGQQEIDKRDDFTGQELKGRKGADRWPMFYLKIQIGRIAGSDEPQELDVLFDERYGNLPVILDVLKAVVYEFLKKYHFRPKRIKHVREDISNRSVSSRPYGMGLSNKRAPEAEAKTASREKRLVGDLATTQLSIRGNTGCPRPDPPFDSWTRIKSGSNKQPARNEKAGRQPTGDSFESSEPSGAKEPDSNSTEAPMPPLFNSDGSLLRAPFARPTPMAEKTDQDGQSARSDRISLNEGMNWTNPATKETTIVDPTTGFVIGPHSDHFQEGKQLITRQSKTLHLHEKPTLGGERSAWLGELLSSWNNPIFKITEPRIPNILREENTSGRSMQPFGCNTWLQGYSEAGPSIQGRVSKNALRNAEIIAQVDRKFIFAKVLIGSRTYELEVPHQTDSLLIIIDQHAADERCWVESLMKHYFEHTTSNTSTACTELLERPLIFEVPVSDAMQFERMAAHFAHWGIHYNVEPISQIGNTGRSRITVTGLPPSIAERCRVEPRLLIELLRKEAWTVDEHTSRGTRVIPADTEDSDATTQPWVAMFHGCPEGILDMINSRACRSSIMFNDPLSRKECADLVRRLADCAFPFQCAHGRPSMVPLGHIGDDIPSALNERKPDGSFMKAFKTWHATKARRGSGD
ncbi:hypothetical protein GGR50DRAFT_659718 [Xylaria sp. CBS 124048]|nr:hypothetical protein GGR50DRAFT_659718 [Xylaria sp. CBS 124048]